VIENEIAPRAMNIVTSLVFAIAAVSVFVAARASHDSSRAPLLPKRLGYVLAVALAAFAVDDGFELHEGLGRWLNEEHGVEAPGPINHVDDLFVLGYLAAAGVLGLFALASLVKRPATLAALTAAGALFVAGIGVDVAAPQGRLSYWSEETLELAGIALAAAVFAREALATGALSSRPRPGASPMAGERPPTSGAAPSPRG
jgi:hypothetical protein